ncbi:hypothetical protein L3V83_10360 [Thiotrichales bacterium 19X7-9]|nr:hypothetical protein [Thiotrichales bacterium 19X7-9]
MNKIAYLVIYLIIAALVVAGVALIYFQKSHHIKIVTASNSYTQLVSLDYAQKA